MSGGPPAPLPPGTSLPGGVGVAGEFLATWTWPPNILFEGWLDGGAASWVPSDEWMNSVEQLAFYPAPPVDAPPQPGDSYKWTRIMQMPRWGWASEISWRYP